MATAAKAAAITASTEAAATTSFIARDARERSLGASRYALPACYV
jgi:hypothetical protein